MENVETLFKQAVRTRHVIIQNFAWAIGYNLIALPLGITGLAPPWVAVIGMSLSSLVVVANALRLSRLEHAAKPRPRQGPHSRIAYA